MTKITLEALQVAFQSQIDALEQAIADVRQDKLVDMSHLDSKVVTLCKEIQNLSGADAFLLEGPLAEIIGKLEMLALELQDFKDRHKTTNIH